MVGELPLQRKRKKMGTFVQNVLDVDKDWE
jgi:hypothetical protein